MIRVVLQVQGMIMRAEVEGWNLVLYSVVMLVLGVSVGVAGVSFSLTQGSSVLTKNSGFDTRTVVYDTGVVDVECEIPLREEYRVSDFVSEFRNSDCSVKFFENYSEKWKSGQVYNKYECNKALYTENLSKTEKRSLPCFSENRTQSGSSQS